jgi:hypothetical protein
VRRALARRARSGTSSFQFPASAGFQIDLPSPGTGSLDRKLVEVRGRYSNLLELLKELLTTRERRRRLSPLTLP